MDTLLMRRRMMMGGEQSYLDWLRSIGCVVWLPLSENGDLQDRISGNSLVQTGKGSMTWDSTKGKYKIATPGTNADDYNGGVAKLLNAIPTSLFPGDCFTTMTIFEKITSSGYYLLGQIGPSTDNNDVKAALAPLYNASGNAANVPSGEQKFAKYLGPDERLFWQNGSLYATYAAAAVQQPSNWGAIDSNLNVGSTRINGDSGYANKSYYLSEVYIFNTKLTLEQIRKIQGYE